MPRSDVYQIEHLTQEYPCITCCLTFDQAILMYNECELKPGEVILITFEGRIIKERHNDEE